MQTAALRTNRDTATPAPPPPPAALCLSVDVEEYFHAEAFAARVTPDDWKQLQRRAQPRIEQIADLFHAQRSRGTFFVLGWMLPELVPLLRQLAAAGHEIACHGDSHQHLRRLSPADFRADVHAARARIEDALGVPVSGFRAPTFSITRATSWALDVLVEEGFGYDSSVFPIRHDRYGVPDAPIRPFCAVTPHGRELIEFPPLTLEVGWLRVPMGGGGYLRLLPGALVRRAAAARLAAGQPVMLYVHPWELDPDQPRLPGGALSQWRHRVNLHTTAGKLAAILRRFGSAPARELIAGWTVDALPRFSLTERG